MPTLDSENLAHNQGISNNSSCLAQDPAKGLAGNVHHAGCCFLIHTLEIAQSDRLQTLRVKTYMQSYVDPKFDLELHY